MPAILSTKSKAPKEDAGKTKWSLLPMKALEQVVKVFEFGCSKYARDSWRKGFAYSDIYDAALRHLTDWWEGEDIEDESKLYTISHAAWNVLILVHLVLFFPENDDRPHKKKEQDDERF
jgi:hypothetical protein